MDPAQLHLLLNHVPILGVLFGLGLIVLAILFRIKEFRLAGYVLFLIAAIVAIPVYLSGAPAEEVVEELAGVSEHFIEEHEDAALISLIAVGILGLLALGAIVSSVRALKALKALEILCFVVALAAFGSFLWTAHLGGQIQHQELRSDYVVDQSEHGEEDD